MIYYAFDPHRAEQEKNVIKRMYPDAKIIEKFPHDNWFLNLDIGDILIIYDIADLCETKESSIDNYISLMNKGVNLKFEHSPECNTDVLKFLQITDVNNYITAMLASYKERIEKEKDYKRQRLYVAGENGKQVGAVLGSKFKTKKSVEMKHIIKQLSSEFDGTLSDKDVMDKTGLARNTYYKYKRELKEENSVSK